MMPSITETKLFFAPDTLHDHLHAVVPGTSRSWSNHTLFFVLCRDYGQNAHSL